MTKKIVSIFFINLFLLFLVAPTIITVIDDSIDVSVFYAVSEEEDKNPKKNIEVLFFDVDISETACATRENENDLIHFNKRYSKPHLNLISPPPKLV